MVDRVYVLMDIARDRSDEAVRILRHRTGVRMADVLESMPNVIMVVEAPDRQTLAKHTIQALETVESITERLQLLPAQDGLENPNFVKPFPNGNS